MPTTSPGSKNDRQAWTASSEPTSSFIPRSSVCLIAPRSFLPSLIMAGLRASITRPGNGPGTPSDPSKAGVLAAVAGVAEA